MGKDLDTALVILVIYLNIYIVMHEYTCFLPLGPAEIWFFLR